VKGQREKKKRGVEKHANQQTDARLRQSKTTFVTGAATVVYWTTISRDNERKCSFYFLLDWLTFFSVLMVSQMEWMIFLRRRKK